MNSVKTNGTKSDTALLPVKITDSTPPVVGIGASAGGLEALKALFSNLSANTGFAFIVVTHQQPGHVSLLPDLLNEYTEMPVISAEDGMLLETDRVFVCPPGKNLALHHRRLHLLKPEKYDISHLPIDYFLRSLAEDAQDMSVGIILSGTGTDGTLGLKAIKGVSGMTMVQEPQTAKFDGMPCSAIQMGDVDFVLPAEKMGQQLDRYRKGPYFKRMQSVEPEALVAPEPIQKILSLLRNRTGNDLSAYKPTTIKRRIARRMNIHQIKNPDKYVQFLQENPVEIDKLFKELLINVTNFFRDAEAYKALENVLPKLLEGKPDNYEFRIWVAGCSSGEEPYSIAILLKECLEKAGKPHGFQIFATDLDESSINRARDGVYPAGIAADVSPERLARFFKLEDNQYRIHKEIRDRVIFATQNIIQDPPFTHLDLISCRNLLIYLGAELQKEILPRFHYALNPGGVLFLGSSEAIGSFDDLFSVIDKKWKIYQRKNVQLDFPLLKRGLLPMSGVKSEPVPFNKALNSEFKTGNIARQIERLLLERYVPVSVVVNEHGKIIYIHGRSGKYLEPAPGQPNWNILEMVREGLRMPLVTSLGKAVKTHATEIINNGLKVKTDGGFETVDMTLTKIVEPEALRDLFVISFLPQKNIKAMPAPADKHKTSAAVDKTQEKEQLEQELYFTKESLRATIEELQTSNEEIKSSNEELQATNEELQSSNEELETSKEEMQSLNEELNTVNSELHNKIEALSDINSDMQNLMNSTDIATIFLDNQLKIKRFTRQAQNIVKLIDSDIGRPLADLVSILKYEHLIDDAKAVLQTLFYKDTEVQTIHGDWYLLRILPYRTAENMIDGLVITFVDITRLKKAEQTAQAAEIASAIVNTINQPLLVLDEQLNILTSNQAYNQAFSRNRERLSGRSLFEINASAWNSEVLRGYLTKTLMSQITFDGFYYEAEFPDRGKKRMIINGRILNQLPGNPVLILLAFDDAAEKQGKHQ